MGAARDGAQIMTISLRVLETLVLFEIAFFRESLVTNTKTTWDTNMISASVLSLS